MNFIFVDYQIPPCMRLFKLNQIRTIRLTIFKYSRKECQNFLQFQLILWVIQNTLILWCVINKPQIGLYCLLWHILQMFFFFGTPLKFSSRGNLMPLFKMVLSRLSNPHLLEITIILYCKYYLAKKKTIILYCKYSHNIILRIFLTQYNIHIFF